MKTKDYLFFLADGGNIHRMQFGNHEEASTTFLKAGTVCLAQYKSMKANDTTGNLKHYAKNLNFKVFSYPNLKEIKLDKQLNDLRSNVFILYNSPESNPMDLEILSSFVFGILKSKKNLPDGFEVIEDSEDIFRTKVFIVHGHDSALRLEVKNFIIELGFEPIILKDQASGGATIIEKIEKYSDVGFGVVLYSPCDIGKENSEKFEFKPRARQNVVFEHGYLIGKLKRPNVCAIIKGEVERPNDFSGVVYITYNSGGGWKIELAKEMMNAGYEVDLNRLID